VKIIIGKFFYVLFFFTLLCYVNNVINNVSIWDSLILWFGYFVGIKVYQIIFAKYISNKYEELIFLIPILLGLLVDLKAGIYPVFPFIFPMYICSCLMGILSAKVVNKKWNIIFFGIILLFVIYSKYNISDLFYKSTLLECKNDKYNFLNTKIGSENFENVKNTKIDYSSAKFTLVDFTRDSCSPCYEKSNTLEKLRLKVNPSQVQIVKVYCGNNYLNYLSKNDHSSFDIYNLKNKNLLDSIHQTGLPFEFIFDSSGKVIYFEAGFTNLVEVSYLANHIKIFN
jgi:hypothetical protein